MDGNFYKSQSYPGIPVQMMEGDSVLNSQRLLMNNGINPAYLSDSQMLSFLQQNPTVQQKSIDVYHRNLSMNEKRDLDLRNV